MAQRIGMDPVKSPHVEGKGEPEDHAVHFLVSILCP